jgi:hypothetical protein
MVGLLMLNLGIYRGGRRVGAGLDIQCIFE